ncbi:MAG: hypothetical protein ACE5MG_09405 [Candidatus Methylomirabilales bacterium]
MVVEVAEGSSIVAVQLGAGDLGISPLLSAPPFEFLLHIRNDLIGPIKLTAFGRTGPEAGVFSAPVTIHIEPPGIVLELSVSRTRIFFERPGDEIPIRVIGTFDNGAVLDITESLQTSFTSNDPSVAMVDSSGLVTAVGTVPPGATEITTEIVVAHDEQSVVVPVIFRPVLTPPERR